MLLGLLAQPADAFWFFCRYREAQKAAEIANKAKERYEEYLSDPRARRAQVEACRQAWDVLRTNTFAAIAEFAQEVPGTTFTGPPNVKDLAKDAVKEAIKEVLGEAVSLHREGMAQPLMDGQAGQFTRPAGVIVAAPANAPVPVGPVTADHITTLSLAYVTSQDYDGSLGEAPPWSLGAGPLLLMRGTFRGIPIAAFEIGAGNPVAAAFEGSAFTPEDVFLLQLEKPALLRGAYDNGFFSPELLGWAGERQFSWDTGRNIRPFMHQAGSIEITEVNPGAGTLSGRFFAIAGPGPLWDNGGFDHQMVTTSGVGTRDAAARAADDFELAPGNGQPWTLQLITAQLVQTSDRLANRAQLEIYRDSGTGSPANSEPLAILPGIDSQTVDVYFTGAPVQEYVFDPRGLQLPPGRYWLAAVGLGDGSGTDRAGFASTGHPFIRLAQGHVLRPTESGNEWVPVELLDGIATDFAFTVDAEQSALAPALQMAPAGSGRARLSWLAGTGAYAVQHASNFAGPWSPWLGPIVEMDGQRHVWVSPTGDSRFYRLESRSRKKFCEGIYVCNTGGSVFAVGQTSKIGFWDVESCPGNATLGDGSAWTLKPLTCSCP